MKMSNWNNISKFILQGSNCYYKQENKIFVNGKIEKQLDPDFFGEFYVNNNNLILQSYYGNFEYLDMKIIGYYNYLDEKEVTYISKEDGCLYFEIDNEFKKSSIVQNILYIDGKYFIPGDVSIICLDYLEENPNKLWQFNLQFLPENPHNDNYDKDADWKIKKIIGILEDKLWLALNHHTIIAIDVNTGKLANRIHNITNLISQWLPSAIPLPEAMVIGEKENKLIGFMWEFYWEIDPKTGEITFYDLTEEFVPQKTRNDLSEFILDNEFIYFTTHVDSAISRLNRNTKKIDWHYAFENDEDGLKPKIMNIQGNENMIGALSSNEVLYLFEKPM